MAPISLFSSDFQKAISWTLSPTTNWTVFLRICCVHNFWESFRLPAVSSFQKSQVHARQWEVSIQKIYAKLTESFCVLILSVPGLAVHFFDGSPWVSSAVSSGWSLPLREWEVSLVWTMPITWRKPLTEILPVEHNIKNAFFNVFAVVVFYCQKRG